MQESCFAVREKIDLKQSRGAACGSGGADSEQGQNYCPAALGRALSQSCSGMLGQFFRRVNDKQFAWPLFPVCNSSLFFLAALIDVRYMLSSVFCILAAINHNLCPQ